MAATTSTKTVPRAVEIIRKVIKETVNSCALRPYSELKPEDREWMRASWISLYDEIGANPDILYKGLVLANRNGAIGKFAFVFNQGLYEAAETRNIDAFRAMLMSVPFPELEDNDKLTDEDRIYGAKELRFEMCVLSHLIDALSHTRERLLFPLLSGKIYNRYHAYICTTPVGSMDFAAFGGGEVRPPFSVLVSDRLPRHQATTAGSFNLIDLCSIVVYGKINPYTGALFSDPTYAYLLDKYRVELAMFVRGLKG
jgi:hypothetical protein